MASKFKIEDLEIEGFRGINSSIELKDFNGALNFIFGGNGAGKSSVLDAIEWCLFGELARQKFTDTKTQDGSLNALSAKNKARVNCTLTDGKIEFVLHREKAAGKRGSSFWIYNKKGEKFEGIDAEQKIETIFGLNFEDFYRAVYLHQGSIRGLILDDPAKRDEAMDRLFGLEKLRTISDSMPLAMIRDKITKIDSERTGLSKKISGAAPQREKDSGEIKGNAKENPKETTEIATLAGVLDKLNALSNRLKQINEVIAETQITSAKSILKSSMPEIQDFYSKLTNHPIYDNIFIDVVQRNVNGSIKNSYLIKAFNSESSKATQANTRLSTAQMTCAALAIYLALSKALQHKLNFLILDDPSQNLDEDHENALVKIINDLSKSTQILLATQDRAFQDLLKSSTKSTERKLIELEFNDQGTVLKE